MQLINMRKKIIVVKTFKVKGLGKWFGYFLFLFHSLRWLLGGTTHQNLQDIHPIKLIETKTCDITCKMSRILGKGCCNIPSMFKVIIDCWLFDLFLRGQVIVLVSFNWDLYVSSFTLQKLEYLCMGDICNLSCHLVLASMPEPIFPHQVDIGEMWLCPVLDLNGWIHWNSFHAMKNIIFGCARISATYSCQYFFLGHGILTTTFSHITHHLPYVYIV
jgi:hypothetical protein